MKMPIVNRLILVAAGHLAGYQIVSGIDGYDAWTTLYYTIAFGVLVLACLLLIIFGYDILKNVMVVVIATLIPLSLSMGIISSYLPEFRAAYFVFVVAGFFLILITRRSQAKRTATISLAAVHGLAGLIIFIIPVVLSIGGVAPPLFSLVGAGGAVIGLAGLLLAFVKMGKPIIAEETIYRIFPALLLLMTALLVAGMAADKS